MRADALRDGRIRRHFEERADEYAEFVAPCFAGLHDYLAAHALAQRPQVVADIACGDGRLGARIRRALPMATIVGIDRGRELLGRASASSRVCGDALHLPFRDDAVDLVLCALGLPFFSDQRRAIAELFRIVNKPCGQVVLAYLVDVRTTDRWHQDDGEAETNVAPTRVGTVEGYPLMEGRLTICRTVEVSSREAMTGLIEGEFDGARCYRPDEGQAGRTPTSVISVPQLLLLFFEVQILTFGRPAA